MTWLTVIEYMCHKWPRICPTCRSTSRSCPHSWRITRFGSRLTRRVPLVEQELLTLPGHVSSRPVFSGLLVTPCILLCVCFVDRCLFFLSFFFWSSCCLFPFGIFTLFLRLVIYMFLYSATERCYHLLYICLIWLIVLNATFNNISAISLWSVLLVEETGVPWENHRLAASHWQTFII